MSDPSSRASDSPQIRWVRSPEVLARIFEFAPDAKFFVGADGRILDTNVQAEHMLGYRREELIGELVEKLIPDRFIGRHVEYRKGYMAAPRPRPMGAGVELFARRKDGTELPVDIMLSPIETDDGTFALAVVRDITERKRAEAETIQARETYLKELHHRVKNNLQVISSLLFLQSRHTDDPRTLEILKESQTRVKSIALIHEKLYRSPELTSIDFAEYARDLVSDLFATYGVSEGTIAIELDVANIPVDIDTAILCGLILNELVSNVLKHAFPDGRGGRVSVGLSHTDDRWLRLTVADDGVGLPRDRDWRTGSSLGLKLVTDLTRQLDGQLDIDSAAGTTFRITFRAVGHRERV